LIVHPALALTVLIQSSDPVILAIETATRFCSVALIDGDRIVAAFHEDVGRGHAEQLIPMIAALPDGGRATSIVAGCGPGSFTGVRVGLAAARGLALAWGVQAFGYSTLALMAAGYFAEHNTGTDVTIVTEGGHGEVFSQHFGRLPFAALSPLSSSVPEVLAPHLLGCAIAGSAVDKITPLIAVSAAHEAPANARHIIHLPSQDLRLACVPVYGREPDAKLPQT
jgi:tRNA threonylcarbamoyladenosine biosynthesis protein TsaB